MHFIISALLNLCVLILYSNLFYTYVVKMFKTNKNDKSCNDNVIKESRITNYWVWNRQQDLQIEYELERLRQTGLSHEKPASWINRLLLLGVKL